MTKQIKDLARKHLIVENERVNNGIRTIEVREEDLEEFIHLIIRECTTKIINSYKGKINPSPAVEAIEQHFGVMFKRM